MFNVKTVLFAFAAVAAAGPAAPAAHGNQTVVTTTRVVQAYTTYCPEPTTLTLGVQTYTVTKPTTLTITDCPCTVVEPCHTCHAQPTGPVNPPVNPVNPPVNTPVAPVNPPVTNSPHPEVTPPVLVSSASERLVQFGAAVLGAAFVGVLAL